MTRTDEIIAIEEGTADEQEMIESYQRMIDSGIVWRLQGCHGRAAADLINSGQCRFAIEHHTDAYGNRIPNHADFYNGLCSARHFTVEQYREWWTEDGERRS